jgi:hypothetical protein
MDITYRGQCVGSITLSKTGRPTTQKGFDCVTVGIPLDFRFDAPEAGRHWELSNLVVAILVQLCSGLAVLTGYSVQDYMQRVSFQPPARWNLLAQSTFTAHREQSLNTRSLGTAVLYAYVVKSVARSAESCSSILRFTS